MKTSQFKEMVKTGIRKTIKQGQPCKDTAGACKYLHLGISCVVGNMMTPEELDAHGNFQGGVHSLYNSGWRSELTPNQLNVLEFVQECHDNLFNRRLWLQRFIEMLTEDKFTAGILTELENE
jgi:hypothetical protein